MVDSKELIRAIVDEDFVSAKEMTNDLLFTTTGEILDVVRQEVAANLFDDDIQEMKDYDKDGVIETPKAEVLGSRINAAVKSGKLSPTQASRTKNKGMFR